MDILFSNNTLIQHGIDVVNTKNTVRISSNTSEDIKAPFTYKKVSSTPTIIYIIYTALKSCPKRDSTI